MSDRVLIHYTMADLENEFTKHGMTPNPKTLKIIGECLSEMPIGKLMFDAAKDALKTFAAMELKKRSGKDKQCKEETEESLEDHRDQSC